MTVLTSNNIYVGEHHRSLDEKGRLLLPSKWRFGQEPNEIYVAMPNPSGCITVFPPQMVAKVSEKVSQVSLGDKKGQKILTRLFSKADQLVCDRQGRISINQMLQLHAGLQREVLMVGNFVTFSVWDNANYDRYLNNSDDEADDVSRILTELGL